MLNIVIPLAGKSPFFDSAEYPFPKPLVEINGKTMIEIALDGFFQITEPKRFIFILEKKDCEFFHLDRVVTLLTEGNCTNVILPGPTRGAACSVLMAAPHIANSDPLIIANGDQKLDVDFAVVLDTFRREGVDGGVISFGSVHPKWSYVKLDSDGIVVETAEKKPISKTAIAGFYYFNRGMDFVEAAMKMIEKEAHVGGNYFIAPSMNELVLANKTLRTYSIEAERHHSLYSPKKISEYESLIQKGDA